MSEETRYDEDDAIRFIRATLPENVSAEYGDDDILYVIDLIWEWYERNGYTQIESDVTDSEFEHEVDITAYVQDQLRRDKDFLIDPANVGYIVKGELQYEESIDDFV